MMYGQATQREQPGYGVPEQFLDIDSAYFLIQRMLMNSYCNKMGAYTTQARNTASSQWLEDNAGTYRGLWEEHKSEVAEALRRIQDNIGARVPDQAPLPLETIARIFGKDLVQTPSQTQ